MSFVIASGGGVLSCVYSMNGEYEGGETRFYEDGNEDEVSFSVKGDAGLCCVFRQPQQACYHHGKSCFDSD